MVYGIEGLIRSGVPAAVFPDQAGFYQVGNGKLHVDQDCASSGNRISHHILAAVFELSSDDFCRKCHHGPQPAQADLREAVQGAEVLRDCLKVLASADAERDS